TRNGAPRAQNDNESVTNGQLRPAPAKAKNGKKGVLIGGLVGGTLAVAVAAGVIWFMNRDSNQSTSNNTNTQASNTNAGADRPNASRLDAPTSTQSDEKKDSSTENGGTEKDKEIENKRAAKAKDKEQTKVELKTGQAVMQKPPRIMPTHISTQTVDRVKKSAVLIKFFSSEGGGDGSGWFAEKGIVITNSHVVGMRSPTSPPPEKLRIVV